jgi:hypothetical protein
MATTTNGNDTTGAFHPMLPLTTAVAPPAPAGPIDTTRCGEIGTALPTSPSTAAPFASSGETYQSAKIWSL